MSYKQEDLPTLRPTTTDPGPPRPSSIDTTDNLLVKTSYHNAGIQFAGRLGGNQSFVLDRRDPENAALLERLPDAAPYMTIRESFDLRGFTQIELWKAALMEGWGAMMLIFLTAYISISPNVISSPPSPRWGVFNNAAFVGPLVGGITNWMLITLFTFSFSPVSGAHLNPLISFGTFCARLTSFPRMILYISFQVVGAALAGLLVRGAYGTRDFKVGGCYIFTEVVLAREALVVELVTSMALLFLAFGVGLDPRQREVFPPAVGPVFVGAVLGVLSFGTGYSRYGYGGASMNPARCFGVFVGSRFPGWHWIHWAGPAVASIVHGVFYFLVPPWALQPDRASPRARKTENA